MPAWHEAGTEVPVELWSAPTSSDALKVAVTGHTLAKLNQDVSFSGSAAAAVSDI